MFSHGYINRFLFIVCAFVKLSVTHLVSVSDDVRLQFSEEGILSTVG